MDTTAVLSVSIAVVVGVVEIFKQITILAKFAPLLSLIFGIAVAFVFPEATVALTVFNGVIIGLSAAGLYSGTKKVIEEKAYVAK